jgi:hypothetical protein
LTCTNDNDCSGGMRCIRIGSSGTCDATEFLSPAIGGSGGDAYTRGCNSDEVMIGARFTYGSWLDSIAPRCVRVTSDGSWSGSVRTLAKVGGNGGPTSVTRDCPRNFAISGFSGREGAYVDQIRFECRRLVAVDRLRIEGTPVLTNSAGSTGGENVVSFHCPGHLPAIQIRGRSHDLVDQIALLCGR